MNKQLLEQEYKTHRLPGSYFLTENFSNHKKFYTLLANEPKLRLLGHYAVSTDIVMNKSKISPVKYDTEHIQTISNYDDLINFCIHRVNIKHAGVIECTSNNTLLATTCPSSAFCFTADNVILKSLDDVRQYTKSHTTANHIVQIELIRWDR